MVALLLPVASVEAAVESVFEVIVGSFLHDLRILQPLYQLKLLLLHHRYLSLYVHFALVTFFLILIIMAAIMPKFLI